MNLPTWPHPPPTTVQPVPTTTPLQQVAIDSDGRPIYAWPATPAPALQQPIVARPWGAYLAGGCVGVLALAAVAVIAFLLLMGLAIVAAVLAVVMVVLTICVIVLRSMWRDYQTDKAK